MKPFINFHEQVGVLPPETDMLKRAREILLQPGRVWPIIAQEKGGLKEAFLPYTLQIGFTSMAIGAVLSATLWGFFMTFVGNPSVLSLPNAMFHCVLAYAYGMFGILVVAKVLEIIAPSFGLRKSWVLSCRLLVYASTPSFAASLFSWIPFLGWLLSIVAFVWGLQLAYQGSRIVLHALVVPASQVKEPAVESNASELVKA